MRKIISLVLFVASVVTVAACDGDRQIKVGKLPSQARSFVEQYFPETKIVYAEKDIDDGIMTYSLTLSDGTEIDFSESGEWLCVDCDFSFVPEAIVPSSILDDLSHRIPQARISKIEKEIGGYEVTVSGRTYLYDYKGLYIREDIED